MLTDSVSDLLFVSEPSGVDNLLGEGIPREKIHLVGNIMIDTLLANLDRASQSDALDRLDLATKSYVLATFHRPSNVDTPQRLTSIVDALDEAQQNSRIVLPVHPRTRRALEATGLTRRLEEMPGLTFTEPLGYLDFLRLMSASAAVVTDSGGIQEETSILGIPCLTLRDTTEWPETLNGGLNRLVPDPCDLSQTLRSVLAAPPQPIERGSLCDGRAAERIVDIILAQF